MKKKHLQQYYDKQVSYFTKDFTRAEYKLLAWHQTYLERMKKYLLDKNFKGKTLLDIGPGEAYATIEMAKLGLNLIATDLTPKVLENIDQYKKKLRLSNIRLLQANAESLPLRDRSVDYIVANAILEHIPNEKKAIEKWKAILKPGGKMMITVPLKFRYVWPFFWPINYIHDKRIGHLRRYDFEDLRDKFKLKVVKHFYTGHFLKVLGFLLTFPLGIDRLDGGLEAIDRKTEQRRYGASNISIIFEKSMK